MAVTSQQILDFLIANPGMSDAQIASAMDSYGVTPSQMAQAVGVTVSDIQQRYEAAQPQGLFATQVTPTAPVTPSTPSGVTNQQIVDFLVTNPNLSDAQIASAMQTYNVTPAQMAAAVGLPTTEVESRFNAALPFVNPEIEERVIDMGDGTRSEYYIKGTNIQADAPTFSEVAPTTGLTESSAPQYQANNFTIYDPQAKGEYVYSPQGQLIGFNPGERSSSIGGFLNEVYQDNKNVINSALTFGALDAAGLLGGAAGTTAGTVGTTGLTTAELAQLDLALGGAGGTAGATALGNALATGAAVPTLTNLTGGSGVLTGAAGGITADSVAAQLASSTVAGTGMTLGELAQLDLALGGVGGTAGALEMASTIGGAGAATAAASVISGMGGGTGITASGAGGLGGLTGAAGLDGALGTGLTTTGAGGLGGATGALGLDGALGAGLTVGGGLTGTGVLTGSELGTALLGTGAAGALTGTGVLTGSTLGTTLLGTGAGTGVTGGLTTGVGTGVGLGTGALTTGVGAGLGTGLSGVTTGVGTGLATGLTNAATTGLGGLTAAQLGSLLSSGLTLGGGLMQSQTSKEAAQRAQARIDAETAAAKQAAAFRPVGMTTRFGTSEFKVDPVTGQITSAGYTLSPEAKNAQDRLVKLAESGLQQAESAQAQFAPLQTGAQNLFNLGNQYIAQSPEQVAQNYLNQQMALLQPGRELELANLQNKLQQQGRGGLAVAQGGSYGATTPELQALYNARAMQEAQLAAQAQQAGQQQVTFGAGLLGQGANAMGQFYGGQQAAYAPYTTALGQVQNLEAAAQQPLTMGINLGQLASQAGANVGKLGLAGAEYSTNLATGQAATNNPYAGILSGLGSSPAVGTAAGNVFSGLFS